MTIALINSYGFSIRTLIFDSAFYDSRSREWRGDLPVGGVPYDIIGFEPLVESR